MVHPNLLAFLTGTRDPNSTLHKLSGHDDVLEYIWQLVKYAWAMDLFKANMKRTSDDRQGGITAFAHLNDVQLPEPTGRYCNMMPFIMGVKASLPEEFQAYWPLICECVDTLESPDVTDTKVPRAAHLYSNRRREKPWLKTAIGYLTVHESDVVKGSSQRRPGLHTEGFVREACDQGGKMLERPWWHNWGFGRSMRPGVYQGGIFMASSVNDSCRVYNTLVPDDLVGKGGDIEHLRGVLNEGFPAKAHPRFRRKDAAGGNGQHGTGCPVGDAHEFYYDGDPDGLGSKRPVNIQAGELFWMTDRTPHESLELPDGGARSFFRLVTSNVDTWYASHSTPNPLGIQPRAKIARYDKFTGRMTVDEGLESATIGLAECQIVKDEEQKDEEQGEEEGSADAQEEESVSSDAELWSAGM